MKTSTLLLLSVGAYVTYRYVVKSQPPPTTSKQPNPPTFLMCGGKPCMGA